MQSVILLLDFNNLLIFFLHLFFNVQLSLLLQTFPGFLHELLVRTNYLVPLGIHHLLLLN